MCCSRLSSNNNNKQNNSNKNNNNISVLGAPSGHHHHTADASATRRGCARSDRGTPLSRTPCDTVSGQAAQPSLVSLASWQPPPATTVPSSRPKAAVLLAGTEHAEAVLEARLLKAEGLHCDAHRSEMAAVAANAFEGHLQLHAVKKRSHWDVGVGGCSSQRPGLEKPKADLWLDVVVHQEGTSCAEVNRHGLYAWLPTDEAAPTERDGDGTTTWSESHRTEPPHLPYFTRALNRLPACAGARLAQRMLIATTSAGALSPTSQEAMKSGIVVGPHRALLSNLSRLFPTSSATVPAGTRIDTGSMAAAR
eukprot:CAMPEP_0203872426 /NCGR_PEP_ID=MMETSP0359-20131031/19239_1 /ASSEMBLY_ACC=CAM_ASM_000338 /TAXON_ID=268821 /ORGANISM="Scrippsiella Hangoei, Strain SHTV-5" /LENGTH=307 /DNA_ID=CAMNT_0050791113 /DNA_START=524 /DNA_END=1448 /DNA_ORIENTATION=-